MAGLMDKLFGTPAPAATTAQPTQPVTGTGQPGNIPPGAANATADGNGVVPATAAATATNNDPTTKSPLDEFSGLWDAPTNTNGAAQPDNFFNVDPQKLMESARKVDFSKAITPDQLTAISQGGEAAMKAFAEAMNSVSQTVFAQSAMASTKIVEAALAKAEAKYDAKIPGMMKQEQVKSSLRQENPIFSHPATQPIISALEQQFTLKYPQASASEITELAKNYLTQFSTALQPKPEVKKDPNEVDWESFLM